MKPPTFKQLLEGAHQGEYLVRLDPPTMKLVVEALELCEQTLSDRGRWVSDDAQAAYMAASKAFAALNRP